MWEGIVLAGGRSERFGRDKALVEVEGQVLWERQCRVMALAGAGRVRVACGGRRLDGGWEMVEDGGDGSNRANGSNGPLGGLLEGFRRVRVGVMVLVGAVDMPCLQVGVWRRLMLEVRGGVGCVPVCGGERQPLAAIYPAAAVGALERVVGWGERRVGVWVDRCKALGLVREVEMPPEWGAAFWNMNTPNEYAAVTAGRVGALQRGL